MYGSSSPVRAFVSLRLAFVRYQALGVGAGMGATTAGLLNGCAALVHLFVLTVLLKPFAPVFRRFTPDRIEPGE